MNQSNSSKQVLLSVIGVAILVVAVVGVSFAFFNYTRTGNENRVRTGHIEFNTSQSVMNVSDLFPVAAGVGKAVENNTTQNGGYATVTITGKTSYTAGLDYRVLAEDVNLEVGGKTLPISVYVTESTETNSGISNNHTYSYNTDNGQASPNLIGEDFLLADGHIDAVAAADVESATGVNHTIYIRTYLDTNKIAITDTLENSTLTPPTGETNGTTSTWLGNRTRFTTAEWNAFHGDGVTGTFTPVSFKIRVEAIEAGGTWTTTTPLSTGATVVPAIGG